MKRERDPLADETDKGFYQPQANTPPPPGGPPPQQVVYVQPKKRRIWPWFLAFAAALVLVPIGCVSLFAAGVEESFEEASKEAEVRDAEIAQDISNCLADLDQDSLWLRVRCTVTNNSSERSDYGWSVGADANGVRYGTTYFIADDLRPGESIEVTSLVTGDDSTAPVPDPATVTLEVFQVHRFASDGL